MAAGLDLGGVLSQKLGPVPVWVIVVGGGVVLAFIAPKVLQRFTGDSTGGAPKATTTAPVDPNLDPNTGVPYAVETAINPLTGQPNYNTLFPPAGSVPVQIPPGEGGGGGGGGGGNTAAQNAATAIANWEAHNRQKWTGPAGSFPAGWGPTPGAPGAGQFVNGVFRWVSPPLVGTGPSNPALLARPQYSQPWPQSMRRIY